MIPSLRADLKNSMKIKDLTQRDVIKVRYPEVSKFKMIIWISKSNPEFIDEMYLFFCALIFIVSFRRLAKFRTQ